MPPRSSCSASRPAPPAARVTCSRSAPIEAAQGAGPLNGDGDTTDGVLQVYDIATKTLTNVGQAVTPCRLEICDPTAPYKVEGASVKFLTLESEQNQDLDGNGVDRRPRAAALRRLHRASSP